MRIRNTTQPIQRNQVSRWGGCLTLLVGIPVLAITVFLLKVGLEVLVLLFFQKGDPSRIPGIAWANWTSYIFAVLAFLLLIRETLFGTSRLYGWKRLFGTIAWKSSAMLIGVAILVILPNLQILWSGLLPAEWGQEIISALILCAVVWYFIRGLDPKVAAVRREQAKVDKANELERIREYDEMRRHQEYNEQYKHHD